MKEFIDNCYEKCISGYALDREEIKKLLDIEIGSSIDLYMQKKSRDVATYITNNQARLWCAIGMDFDLCPMNCKFCSMGEKWHLVNKKNHISTENLLSDVTRYVNLGAGYIVLRTTEFYSVDMLINFTHEIREKIPGNYEIVFNTGELDLFTAKMISENGIYGCYHALRLGEGIDTPFDKKTRIDTMKAISSSGLNLMTLIEPLSYDHTNDEITDIIINAIECEAFLFGVMALNPVKGTPFEDKKIVDNKKMAHVVSVARLSCGTKVKEICAYPSSIECMNAGANVTVIETGAIPRSDAYCYTDWMCENIDNKKKLLKEAGYTISMPPAKAVGLVKCPCAGTTDEDFLKPMLLILISKEDISVLALCKKYLSIMNYDENNLDVMAEIGDVLKDMNNLKYIDINNNICSITRYGIKYLTYWKNKIEDYKKSIDKIYRYIK